MDKKSKWVDTSPCRGCHMASHSWAGRIDPATGDVECETTSCEDTCLLYQAWLKQRHHPDLESFLERVVWLRDTGYHVPDGVIEEIREEIREAAC